MKPTYDIKTYLSIQWLQFSALNRYNWTRVSQIKEIWTDGVEKHEADDYIKGRYFVVYVMIKLFSDYTLMSFRISHITAPDICFHVSCFQNIRPS